MHMGAGITYSETSTNYSCSSLIVTSDNKSWGTLHLSNFLYVCMYVCMYVLVWGDQAQVAYLSVDRTSTLCVPVVFS